MFCTKCGNAVSDTAKFCPVCGTPVDRGIFADEMREIIASPEVPVQAPVQDNTTHVEETLQPVIEPVQAVESMQEPEISEQVPEPTVQAEAPAPQVTVPEQAVEPAPQTAEPEQTVEPVPQAVEPVPQAAEPAPQDYRQDVPDITLTAQKWIPEENGQIAPVPDTAEPPRKKGKKALIITLCAVVVVLGLAVGAAFLISGKYSDKVDAL
ncbi:MAG: zinc-ribbon domain-containing protein, partial [Lachnospiraceae bacterium]|nr:zinc-ribbon domain-containing protein [Lachnospiraceae bacterium]